MLCSKVEIGSNSTVCVECNKCVAWAQWERTVLVILNWLWQQYRSANNEPMDNFLKTNMTEHGRLSWNAPVSRYISLTLLVHLWDGSDGIVRNSCCFKKLDKKSSLIVCVWGDVNRCVCMVCACVNASKQALGTIAARINCNERKREIWPNYKCCNSFSMLSCIGARFFSGSTLFLHTSWTTVQFLHGYPVSTLHDIGWWQGS